MFKNDFDHAKGLTRFVLYLCCVAGLTGSNSISRRNLCLPEGQIPWENPCGASASHRSPPNNTDHNWREFIKVLTELKQQFTTLKATYMGDSRIRTTINRCWNLDSDFFHLEGFPVPNTSILSMRPSDLNETVEALEDFTKLGIILIFVEQMMWDELFYGNSVREFCDITIKTRSVMCTLEEYINNHSLIDTVSLDRSAMKTEYRLGDRTSKLSRNYLIFKDAGRYLGVAINKYIRFMFFKLSIL